jgi:hypothetical protein
MTIEYKYKVGTPIFMVCTIGQYGTIKSQMFVNKIDFEQDTDDNFLVKYNLLGTFVNIDVYENMINYDEGVNQQGNKIWFFDDELKRDKFYNDNFSTNIS